MSQKRANKIEKQRRIDLITQMIGRGISTSQVTKALMEHCNISSRQAYRYLKSARQQFEELIRNPSQMYSLNYLRREHLYMKALEDKQFDSANRILDSSEKALRQGGFSNGDVNKDGLDGSELADLLAVFKESEKPETE